MASRFLLFVAVVTTTLAVCSATFAQGTATGPFTALEVEPGPIVNVGSITDPIPIDLDPNGPPWTKSITDPQDIIPDGAADLEIVETIQNVGTEAWGDWHEFLLDPVAGGPPITWGSVTGLSVNGVPITFSVMGLGTDELWLDDFSTPVLPGDLFEIRKIAIVDGTQDEIARLFEFPTPVPEPMTLTLLSGCGLTLRTLRRRSI